MSADFQSQIQALDSDLRNLCDEMGIDFDDLCERAGRHLPAHLPEPDDLEPLTEDQISAIIESEIQIALIERGGKT